MGDDYTYRLIFNTADRVESFSDIVQSQQNHYQTWGGRVVVHTIAQLLLLLPNMAMDIVNSLAFIALIVLIYKHINHKKPLSLSLLAGIFLLLWILEPFAETVLWITGSANYMWGCMIILAFFLPYRMINDNADKLKLSNDIGYSFIMLLAGIIAGWTNENIAAGLILMVVALIYYRKKNNLSAPLWMYSGLVGLIIGYLLMIAAPGNAARAQEVHMGVFSVVYRLFKHTQTLINFLGLLNLAYIVLFYIIYKNKSKGYKDILSLSFIYELGALASIYIMIFSPSFPERAWFGVIAFNIIAVGILLVNTQLKNIHIAKYALVCLGTCVFIFNSYDIWKDISYVEKTLKERETYILKSKSEGKEIIYIEKYRVNTKYAMPDPVYAEPLMPRYYGITVKYK